MSVTFYVTFFCVGPIKCEARHIVHCSIGIYSPLSPRFHLFLARFLVVNYRYLRIARHTKDTITALLIFLSQVFSLYCLLLCCPHRLEEIA